MDLNEKKFEDNRKALLQKLSQAHRDKVIKRKVEQIKSKGSFSQSAAAHSAPKIEKKNVVIFGTKSLFINSLQQLLQQSATLFLFDDSEKATGFIMDNSIGIIILDMDPPTDWKAATDIFSSIMIMLPESKFLLCTVEPKKAFIQSLVAQGAKVAQKPVAADDLLGFLNAS
jgi:hypothetical protein